MSEPVPAEESLSTRYISSDQRRVISLYVGNKYVERLWLRWADRARQIRLSERVTTLHDLGRHLLPLVLNKLPRPERYGRVCRLFRAILSAALRPSPKPTPHFQITRPRPHVLLRLVPWPFQTLYDWLLHVAIMFRVPPITPEWLRQGISFCVHLRSLSLMPCFQALSEASGASAEASARVTAAWLELLTCLKRCRLLERLELVGNGVPLHWQDITGLREQSTVSEALATWETSGALCDESDRVESDGALEPHTPPRTMQIRALTRLTLLELRDFAPCKVIVAFMRIYRKELAASNLRSVSMTDCSFELVKNEGLFDYLGHKTLTKLRFAQPQLSNSAALEGGAKFGDHGAMQLAKWLPSFAQLRYLDLTSAGIHDSGLTVLAAALPSCSHLCLLALAGNPLTRVGLLELSRALPLCGNLRALDVQRCRVFSDASCMRIIASALGKCTALECLKISVGGTANLRASHYLTHVHDLFGDRTRGEDVAGQDGAGGDAFREGPVLSGPLRSLDDDESALTMSPVCVRALAIWLPHCLRLRALVLSDNGLDEDGIEELLPSLPHCAALRYVDISHNALGNGGLRSLACAIPRCSLRLQSGVVDARFNMASAGFALREHPRALRL